MAAGKQPSRSSVPGVARLLRRLSGRRPADAPVPMPPVPMPPDRLELRVDGQVAIVTVRLAKASGASLELQVRRRDGDLVAGYSFGAPDTDDSRAVTVDLGVLVRTHGLRETANLYLTWERTTKTGATRTVRQRLGGFPDTVRPPSAQRVVVDDLELRLDVTVRGNVALRVDDDPGTGPRLTTSDVSGGSEMVELVGDLKTHNARAAGRRPPSSSGAPRGPGSSSRRRTLPTRWPTRQDNGLLHFGVAARLDLVALARELPEVRRAPGRVARGHARRARRAVRAPVPFLRRVRRAAGWRRRSLEQDGMTHLFMPYLHLPHPAARLPNRTTSHRGPPLSAPAAAGWPGCSR